MGNRHIKVINGKKYYYESIRVGKKVTSRYLGPVEPARKSKISGPPADEIPTDPVSENIKERGKEEEKEHPPEESYIG